MCLKRMKQFFDFNFLNKTPLQIACKNGHLEVVKLLLSTKKVDLNFDNGNGKKPLYYALVSGNIELIKLLGSVLQPEEDKEKINFYFIPACRSGNLELIQLFLNKYGDLIDINTNECPSECISIFFFYL